MPEDKTMSLREKPNTSHPARDLAMSIEEREHCRALVGTHSAGINFALGHGDETAISQGIPPTIRYRCMAWAALHRTAMSAAHYAAIAQATDDEFKVAAQEFGDELRDLILKQMEGSRESVAEIETRHARG